MPNEPIQPSSEVPVAPIIPATNRSYFANSTPTAPGETPTTVPTTPVEGGVIGSGPAPVEEPPKKKKGLKLAIIIAAAVVLLGGGGASAYQFWYQNPEKVVTDSIQSALFAKSLSSKGTIIYSEGDTKMSVAFDANANEAGAGEVAVKATIETGETSYTVDGAGLFDKDGAIFFKLNDLAKTINSLATQMGITDISAFDELIAKVDGNWIRISADDVSEYSKEYSETQTCFTDALKSLRTDAKQKDELADLYSAHRFITIGESLGSKSVDGVGSIGYAVSLDETKFKDFYKGMADTQLGKNIVACDNGIDFSDTEGISTEGTDDTKTEVNIWTSRFGHELTQVEVIATQTDDSKVNVTWNPIFNKPVTIESPKDFIKVKDLMADIQTTIESFYASYQ